MLKALLLVPFVIAISFATSQDEWAEVTQPKIPIKTKPIGLLDETASRILPGARRGSLEEQAVTAGLSVQLDAVNPIVDLSDGDDDFLVVFTVFNPTDKNVQLLKRDTPLEGMVSNLFVVQNPEGRVMKYRGKDVKRDGQPGPEEYATLKAGESISERIRLSRRYELDGDGLYYIRVKQPMDAHIRYSDVMRTEVKMMIKGTMNHEERDQERARAREERAKRKKSLIEDSAGGITFSSGCTSSHREQLRAWHADAADKIAAAKACTKTSCSSLVDTWFGRQTSQAQFAAGATAQFETMDRVKDNTQYICQGSSGSCSGGSTFAYVYPSDATQQVYMCDFTFNYPDYSEKVQTVIHELSHFNHIGDTNDNAYGESTCINLAQSDFTRAIQTADNVGYFGKYVNQCFRNAPSGYTPKAPPTVGCTNQYSNCPQLAANGCSGRTSAGAVSDVCCASCNEPSNSGDPCSGAPNGGGSSGGGSSGSRRRSPSPPPPPPPSPPSGGGTDKYGNCPNLVSQHGCSACCLNGESVQAACGASCGSSPPPPPPPPPPASSRRRASSSSGGDSCRYANDNVCDEPTYCSAGTDTSDCN